MAYVGEQKRAYERQWVAARRAAYFADKLCKRCGSLENLELDHIDPSTKISNSIWSWSEERRIEELAKCQVLCHDCHWIKTKQDLHYGNREHGDSTRYNLGCRCVLCRTTHSSRLKEWRGRTGYSGSVGRLRAQQGAPSSKEEQVVFNH